MIKVENLTKVFPQGNVKAVNNISFTLERGEIGCLIGTSGCGKTTTLKMINLLIEPTEGEIIVNHNNRRGQDPVQWRREIGYVVQKGGLLPHMTIEENIALLSNILKRNPAIILERVKELMEMVNLPFAEYADRYPIELSGGQQQRVGIARSIMEDPPVLLMDEPFGALDPITRKSMHEEFSNLNEKLQKTILMVTHDLEEAFGLGDKIFLMDKGSIIQAGSKEDFIHRPKTQFVEDFIKGHLHEA